MGADELACFMGFRPVAPRPVLFQSDYITRIPSSDLLSELLEFLLHLYEDAVVFP
jgi:hypothetical protein